MRHSPKMSTPTIIDALMLSFSWLDLVEKITPSRKGTYNSEWVVSRERREMVSARAVSARTATVWKNHPLLKDRIGLFDVA